MPLSELMLSQLFNDATGGNPTALSALSAAKDDVFPPDDMTPPPPPMENKFPTLAPVSPNSIIGASPGQPTNEKPSWWGENKADVVRLGLAGLAGAFGQGGQAFGQGLAGKTLEDMREKQAEGLRRRQQAWNDAYEEAKSLPPDILNDPNLQELRDAQAALMKDLQGGKIDNEKTLGQFLTAKSKYSKEIENAKLAHQMDLEKQVEDRKMNEDFARRAQQVTRWKEIMSNPGAFPPGQVALAQQALASMPEEVETPYGKVPMTPEEKAKWFLAMEERKDRQERDIWGRKMDVAHLGISQAQFGFQKERAASDARNRAVAGAARQIGSSISQQLRIKAREAQENVQPFNEQAETDAALIQQAPAIEQAVGLQVRNVGDAGDMGLNPNDPYARPPSDRWQITVFGEPHDIDYDPTTKEGKIRLLREIWGALQSHGAGSELGLLGAYGGY